MEYVMVFNGIYHRLHSAVQLQLREYVMVYIAVACSYSLVNMFWFKSQWRHLQFVTVFIVVECTYSVANMFWYKSQWRASTAS